MERSRHLSLEERKVIEGELKNGATLRHIARLIGRDPSGVRKEIIKNITDGPYSAEKAHNKLLHALRYRRRKELSEEDKKLIEHLINEGRSFTFIKERSGMSGGAVERYLAENKELMARLAPVRRSVLYRLDALEALVKSLIEIMEEKQ